MRRIRWWLRQRRWWLVRKLVKDMSSSFRDIEVVPYGGFMGVCDMGGYQHRDRSVAILRLTPYWPDTPSIRMRLCEEHKQYLIAQLQGESAETPS